MALNDFAAAIRQSNVARPSRFSINLTPPPFMLAEIANSKDVLFQSELVNLLVETAQIPEFILATAQTRDDGVGRELVVDKIYPPITCSFICDGDMQIKRFFDRWSMGAMISKTGTFRYKEDYSIETMDLNQLDQSGNVVYTARLFEVYPKLVNDLPFNASSKDYQRIQVQFVYHTWEPVSL